MNTKQYWTALAMACALVAGCDGSRPGTDAGSGEDAQVAPECTDGTTLCGDSCVSTETNRAHCGGCDQACGAGEACIAGACDVVCPTGQEVCDGACADLDTDRAHCGACGTACGAGEICTGAVCEISCPADQIVCDSACVDTASHPGHCGACGAACDPGQVCSESACASSCDAALTECSGACVDVSVDPAHCGGCDSACIAGAGASGICIAGACRAVCDVLTGDCNGDLGAAGSDGCETPLATDARNCGACGRTCGFPNAIGGCAAGECTIAMCAAGFGDCDASLSNGCETGVADDEFNCGACGTVCAAGEGCILGACMPVIGEDCDSAIPLAAGASSVGWSAFLVDYLTTRPSCTSSALAGPDVVLSYTATTSGDHTFTLTPPASTRWAMVLSTAPCGTVSPLECASAFGSPMVASAFLAAGQTIYLYVADTTSGSSPLIDPLSFEVAVPSCAAPTAPAITALEPASGTTTSTLTPTFEVTFDAAVHQYAGIITIVGDMGTSLSYDLSAGPTEVSFDATETVMTIAPGVTFPSAEELTLSWTGLVGRACGTPVPAPSWTVDVVCMAAFCATCTDGVANGAETDVDCGGTSTCPRCGDGLLCPNGPSDCVSIYCDTGRCGCQPGFADCDGDTTNGCELDGRADPLNCGGCGTTCALGESCHAGVCLTQGTGENCSSPWILTAGANTVSWTATSAEYLTTTPSCVAVGVVEGPDLVLTYTAAASGTHRLDFDKPTSTRWVAIPSTQTCGTLTPSLGCISDWAPSTMGGSFSLTAGETVYVYVRDTSSGSLPLDNPMTVTLTTP